jgi:asparagine synthetase B (glutamine-hydrolysing)
MSIPRIVNEEVQTLLDSVVPMATVNDLGIQKAIDEENIDGAATQLLYLLDKSVQRRVINAPLPKSNCQSDVSVAILFSGGIDSVILAALSHRHIPPDRTIDLINVSFYNDSDSSTASPDRLAALLSYLEITAKWPERNWRFIAVDVSYQEVLDVESRVLRLMYPLESTMDFNISVAFWFAGRGKGRVVSQAEANEFMTGIGQRNKAKPRTSVDEPLLRFANGVADRSDTINCTRTSNQHAVICIREGCGRKRSSNERYCLFNACKFCCGKLQSPISKFLGQRVQICFAHSGTDKISQATTSRATLQPSDNNILASNAAITSTAKILISGVGADEQMAGYGRHRTTFQRGGYTELRDELQMEVGRLWTRNLGRDDRCLSDCGKEARFPFLDEDVVAYLEALPVQSKCNLNLPQGLGDKLILRKVARMIGIHECSALVKRAIQFGSRIAKVSDKNRFGSQRQASGQAKHIKG